MTCKHQAAFGLPLGSRRCELCAADAQLQRKYGITLDERDQLLADQGGGCAICGYLDGWGEGDIRHSVDHDHSCCPGEIINRCCVRSVLCRDCNTLLGRANDNPEWLINRARRYIKAADYLARSTHPFQSEAPQGT